MTVSSTARQSLFFAGLAAIFLSFALQAGYATDADPVPLSSPSTLGLFAVGGIAAIVLSLVGRRRK